MLKLYRGHWILLLCDRQWWCEITERSSGEILPTAATANFEEGMTVCLERARRIIDKYVSFSPTTARVTCIAPVDAAPPVRAPEPAAVLPATSGGTCGSARFGASAAASWWN